MPFERRIIHRLWFEEPLEPRQRHARAYAGLPLSYLRLPPRTRLALERHFGRYETVADVLCADGEIRHVRNLGSKSLAVLDTRLKALMASGEDGPAEGTVGVLRAVQTTTDVLPLDALAPDSYPLRPWFEADPAAREAVAIRFDAMPVAAWQLSNRSRNALSISVRYRTVGAVLRADGDIRACRGLGATTLAELHERAVAVFAGTDPACAWTGGSSA